MAWGKHPIARGRDTCLTFFIVKTRPLTHLRQTLDGRRVNRAANQIAWQTFQRLKQNMKLKNISLTITAALALGLAGCNKNEPATPAGVSAADAAAKAADAAKTEAEKAAEAAKAEAAKATETAKTEAASVADAAKAEAEKAADAAKIEAAKVAAAQAEAANNTMVQGLIDKAKTLIAEGKFADAASVLQQLTGQTLTAEQTKLVASLNEQVQKALAAKATENVAGNVGNLLKK